MKALRQVLFLISLACLGVWIYFLWYPFFLFKRYIVTPDYSIPGVPFREIWGDWRDDWTYDLSVSPGLQVIAALMAISGLSFLSNRKADVLLRIALMLTHLAMYFPAGILFVEMNGYLE